MDTYLPFGLLAALFSKVLLLVSKNRRQGDKDLNDIFIELRMNYGSRITRRIYDNV